MFTLDPFVIREYFNDNDIIISDLYLKIDKQINSNIDAFIEAEMSPLLSMTFDEGENANIFSGKMLMISMGAEKTPLTQEVNLYNNQSLQNFRVLKTIFYYKWKMKDILPKSLSFASELIKVFPRGSNNLGINVDRLRISTFVNLYKLVKELKNSLEQYDEDYKNVIEQKNPKLLLKFLSNSPNVLKIIAERVDALDHITGFWQLRFPDGTRPIMTHSEFAELLSDFESNLRFENQ